MTGNYNNQLYNEYEKILEDHIRLKKIYRDQKDEIGILQSDLDKEEKENVKIKGELQEKILENEALKKEILRLNGLLGADGTNSGIPTSKTPINKKKVVPNSREKSNKKRGGQAGHGKSILKAFDDEEVNEIKKHTPNECPHCGGEVEEGSDSIIKDELDYEVVVKKIRHHFIQCHCKKCEKDFHAPIPNNLKEKNQYGSGVKALGLSLMNIGNVSLSKVRKMIYGLTETEIHPTEGWLVKQQKSAALSLTNFMEDLKKHCLKLPIIHWDDTVIDIDKKRACLRFYGDEKVAYYTAHNKKNKECLDKDGILPLLSKETVVMHDHNKVNYNECYSFSNIECNVHLLRDLQRVVDDVGHEWAKGLKSLLQATNEERNRSIERGEKEFSSEYTQEFYRKYHRFVLDGYREDELHPGDYCSIKVKTLLNRLMKYKSNYTAWILNFNLPFSNNLSERSLRGVKSKMKVAGQFHNEEMAQNYAIIKSYIETCYRNNINQMEALVRLCTGKPYTVNEIFLDKATD